MTETTGSDFRVGRVLGAAWAVYLRKVVPFSMIALFLLLPLPAIRLLSHLYMPLFAAWDPTTTIGGTTSWIPIILYLASHIFLTQIIIATLVYGTLQEMRAHSVSNGEAMTRGLRSALRVFGVVMVLSVMVGFSAVILIIPGYIIFVMILVFTFSSVAIGLGAIMLAALGLLLFVMFWVTIPVAVVERPGIIASLRRSAILTKGSRWRILGVVAVLCVISFLSSTLLEWIVGTDLTWQVSAYVDYALTALLTAVFAVVITVGYHDLLPLRDGVDPESIGAVFD